MSVDTIIQISASVLTIILTWMAGSGDRRAWIIGLVNQVLWLTIILRSETYGLLVLTFFMSITYSRNVWRTYVGTRK